MSRKSSTGTGTGTSTSTSTSPPITDANSLGSYLKDRRMKLDSAAFGFSSVRRRTPGLRREEVAQRAHISATWYTWLEQGAAARHRPRRWSGLPAR